MFIALTVILHRCSGSNKKTTVDPDLPTEVIAYYAGDKESINRYDLSGLTQLIYSFLHLKGNELAVDNAADSLTLMHLTALKSKYPKLKIQVSWEAGEVVSPTPKSFPPKREEKILHNLPPVSSNNIMQTE